MTRLESGSVGSSATTLSFPWLPPTRSRTKWAVPARGVPAEQKWAVIRFAALSAGEEGGSMEETLAVSTSHADTESATTNRIPDESEAQSRRQVLGRLASAKSACRVRIM